MRVLFIPNVAAVVPHLVPLIALSRQLDPARCQSAFLVPRAYHARLRGLGLTPVDIDYRPEHAFRNEMAACWGFRPDVVVDDLSMTALFSCKLAGKPRVTVLRTGAFPGAAPKDATHRHSSEAPGGSHVAFDAAAQAPRGIAGLRTPTTIAEACAAEIGIIPGSRSLEVLPEALDGDPAFIHAGSLGVPDSDIPVPGPSNEAGAAVLSAFLDRQGGRKVVFATLGSVLKAHAGMHEALRYLLEKGAAVISTVDVPDLPSCLQERFHHMPFVPMNEVCRRADMMVHHCGSGTYQYAINHELPAICLGSRCYDRDDIALRLDELGVARYIPYMENAATLAGRFREAFDSCMGGERPWYDTARKGLRELRLENESTAACFDFEKVLERVVRSRVSPAVESALLHVRR